MQSINMRPTTPNFTFSQAGPSSPPETPTTSDFTFSKKNRRHGVLNFSHSLPRSNGTITANGNGPHFSYNPSVRPEDLSPRSSTPSSEASDSPPRSLSSEPDDPINEPPPQKPPTRTHVRIVAEGNFTVEEMGESECEDWDSDDDNIIRPNQYEDAESDPARSVKGSDLDPHIIAGLADLDCSVEDPHAEHEAWIEAARAEKRRRRRSSATVQKRTISQSIGSDTDEEDLQPIHLSANEAGSSARRLRRKVGERISLIFEDPPPRIPELEEPDSCEEVIEEGDEDGRGVFRELPYFFFQEMEVDSDDD